MSDERLATRTVDAAEARERWDALLAQVTRRETRVVVEANGEPIAALIPVDDLARFTRFEEERRHAYAVVEEMREAFRDVPPEEVEREAARAIAEIRHESYHAVDVGGVAAGG